LSAKTNTIVLPAALGGAVELSKLCAGGACVAKVRDLSVRAGHKFDVVGSAMLCVGCQLTEELTHLSYLTNIRNLQVALEGDDIVVGDTVAGEPGKTSNLLPLSSESEDGTF
jgi:hypothetical protein